MGEETPSCGLSHPFLWGDAHTGLWDYRLPSEGPRGGASTWGPWEYPAILHQSKSTASTCAAFSAWRPIFITTRKDQNHLKQPACYHRFNFPLCKFQCLAQSFWWPLGPTSTGTSFLLRRSGRWQGDGEQCAYWLVMSVSLLDSFLSYLLHGL